MPCHRAEYHMQGMLEIKGGIKGVLPCAVWPSHDHWNYEITLARDQNRTFTYSFDTSSRFVGMPCHRAVYHMQGMLEIKEGYQRRPAMCGLAVTRSVEPQDYTSPRPEPHLHLLL